MNAAKKKKKGEAVGLQQQAKTKKMNLSQIFGLSPKDMAEARKVLVKESSSIQKFLAHSPGFEQDCLLMEPTKEGTADKASQDNPLAKLHKLVAQHSGLSNVEVAYVRAQDKQWYCLTTVNSDAGVICGFGAGKDDKFSRYSAAADIVSRVSQPVGNPAEEVRAAASATGSEEGAQAATALRVLSKHLDNVSLSIQQPVSAQYWTASLTASCQGKLLYATSGTTDRHETREEAIVASGEHFMNRLRHVLKIPKDAPNAPEQWAEDLEYTTSKRKLILPPMCKQKGMQLVRELLGTAEEQAERTAALDAATLRQEQRIATMAEMSQDTTASGYPGADVKVKRCFHVHTPEEEDWRREEIKGVLPAEKVREQLAKALETQQVVVVSGGTGSGKSTQLPQFILDDFTEWQVEGEDAELDLQVGMHVEVEYEEEWWDCEVLEVSDDKKTIMAKYFDGGDEEPDVDVSSRVRAAEPSWKKSPPRIVVTQPRRIAAVSLAERVAYERYGEVGGEIGHSVRGDTIMPESDTGTVEYCTVGTLLRRLTNDPLLTRYNVVVLDEIHERDLMTDFLLILIKEVLPKRRDMRLVLMSATLDVRTFVKYLPGCATVEVPVGTRYPVEEIHLEDPFFAKFPETQHLLSSEEEGRSDDTKVGIHNFEIGENMAEEKAQDEQDEEETSSSVTVGALMEQIRQLCCFSEEVGQAWIQHCGGAGDGSDGHRYLDNETMGSRTVEDLLEFLNARGIRPWHGNHASWEITASSTWWGTDANDTKFVDLADRVIREVLPDMLETDGSEEDPVGSILVFLPGWAEIKLLGKKLENGPEVNRLWILPLHSQVAREDQQLIFEHPPEGKVKVILGTNMAESSVTINDVKVVVDAGLHREMSYDPRRRLSFMETVWISQSNAVQRKGRAGRVRSGRVYRLYTKDQFESVPWRPAPEMQRCNLAQTCLQAIHLGRDPREFLAKAPDAPPVSTMEAAMAELVSVDAVRDGVPPRMLPVGQILCRMPLEPLLGRAMMLGTLFGVPQTTAALLSAVGGRSPFVSSPERRTESMRAQMDFCDWSDPVGSLRALTEFEQVYQSKGQMTAQQWASYYFLNYHRLFAFSRIKFQLLQDVQRSGLLDGAAADGMNPEEWLAADEDDEDAASTSWFQDDSGGAIFEAGDSFSLAKKEWLEDLKGSGREVPNEKLMVGILCAAYPTNLAVRDTPNAKTHQTGSVAKAVVDRRSVNCNIIRGREERDFSHLPSPCWWLFSELRMFNGQVVLCETTSLTDWQVSLFGGLRAREAEGVELDNWVNITSRDAETQALVRNLRKEIREALVWIAIAASWDRVAQAAAARAMKLLAILGAILQDEEPDEEDVEYVRNFQLPDLPEGESAIGAGDISHEELSEQLRSKTVVELRALLKELGEVQRGKKADLVERAADAMLSI